MISKYWPGPLTVILKARGGGKTGFRMPANAVARELIAASGVVAAPSANLSGKRPPVTARDVAFSFAVYTDPALETEAAPALAGKVTIEPEDSSTVLLRFVRAYPEQWNDATWHVRILPAHIWEPTLVSSGWRTPRWSDRPCVTEPCTSPSCDHRWLTDEERRVRIRAVADVLGELVLSEALQYPTEAVRP